MLGELDQWWDPKIVFLSETKIKKKAMEKINFVNGFIVPRKGRAGGLAMLWKREVVWKSWDILEAVLMRLPQNKVWVSDGELQVFMGTQRHTEGRSRGKNLLL